MRGVGGAEKQRNLVQRPLRAGRAVYGGAVGGGTVARSDGVRHGGDLPFVVITAVKPCPPQVSWTCSDPAVWPVWRQLHSEWADRSTASLHVVSARTEHYVMNDQPSLIVDAVKFVLDQVRAAKP